MITTQSQKNSTNVQSKDRDVTSEGNTSQSSLFERSNRVCEIPLENKRKVGNVKIGKAFVSFRIPRNQWMPENRFQELLALFQRYRKSLDELAFFSSDTSGPLPLEAIGERCQLLKQRMSAARAKGFRAGVNVLCTLGGHCGEQDVRQSLGGNDYTGMTDINGKVSRVKFCPNDERMLRYVACLYDSVVRAEPDFIWIDDDVCLSGGCFCDICLRLFAKECGARYTRELLKEAFDGGSLGDKMRIRRAWLQHNRLTMERLLAHIEKTVHTLKPGMTLGLMTGTRFYEGYDFDRWAEVLSGSSHAPVMWRPGGGPYEDKCMAWLLDSSLCRAQQVALLPPQTVLSIQAEIENFTYQRLKKSAYATALQAAADIAGGCTGAAFNVLSMYDEPLNEYEPLVAHLEKMRPFYDRMVSLFGRSQTQGVLFCWNKDMGIANNLFEGTWRGENGAAPFHRFYIEDAVELLQIGIPMSFSPEHASALALSGDFVLALSDEEILRALSSGVYLDVQALIRLNERGYSQLTGFAVERWVERDFIEEFTDDPLNGVFANRQRNSIGTYGAYPAALLRPLADSARILARAVDYGNEEIGRCCLGVFENGRGGRVGVAGHCPWALLQNLSKSAQIKALFRWLSRDTLPGYVESYHKAALYIRGSEEGRISGALINASMDPAESVTLLLRTDTDDLTVIDMQGAETSIRSVGQQGDYRRFVLPTIAPWHMLLLAGKT